MLALHRLHQHNEYQKGDVTIFNLPLGIGQVHAMHELFKADPRLAIIVLALLIALAFYFNNRR